MNMQWRHQHKKWGKRNVLGKSRRIRTKGKNQQTNKQKQNKNQQKTNKQIKNKPKKKINQQLPFNVEIAKFGLVVTNLKF